MYVNEYDFALFYKISTKMLRAEGLSEHAADEITKSVWEQLPALFEPSMWRTSYSVASTSIPSLSMRIIFACGLSDRALVLLSYCYYVQQGSVVTYLFSLEWNVIIGVTWLFVDSREIAIDLNKMAYCLMYRCLFRMVLRKRRRYCMVLKI